MSRISFETAKMVVDEGTFYPNPIDHYHDRPSVGSVSCDYCGKLNIQQCYGLHEYDVCRDCAHNIYKNGNTDGRQICTSPPIKMTRDPEVCVGLDRGCSPPSTRGY